MKTFQQHLKDTQSFEKSFVQLNRKPVYKGSAIFPVFQSSTLQSRIHFMGYWMVKKNISEIGLLVTLRDEFGQLIYRYKDQITKPVAKQIELSYLLEKIHWLNDEFIGSIELEVFSSRDLIFPYPAFIINYYNDNSSAVVHTTGRVFENQNDYINTEESVKEAGFDLIGDKDIHSFITFVNGNKKVDKTILELEFINSSNESKFIEINIGETLPYQTTKLVLNNYLDLNKFLKGQTGTIKIKHPFDSFFPRFIAGNYDLKTQAIGITHTFYDNSDNDNEVAYWKNEDRELMHDSAVFIPLFINNGEYTKLKLYPIASPSSHIIDLIFYSKKGEKLYEIKKFKTISGDLNTYESIDFISILNENGYSDKHNVAGVLILKSWIENKIPTRLKYGLNVGLENRSYDLPTNICFASQISNLSILKKKGTFKWFPLIGSANSRAIIHNSSFLKNYSKEANIRVSYYSKTIENTLEEEITLAPFEQIEIRYTEKLIQIFNDETIWITITSDNPFINAWYFTFNDSGAVGGDHSF